MGSRKLETLQATISQQDSPGPALSRKKQKLLFSRQTGMALENLSISETTFFMLSAALKKHSLLSGSCWAGLWQAQCRAVVRACGHSLLCSPGIWVPVPTHETWPSLCAARVGSQPRGGASRSLANSVLGVHGEGSSWAQALTCGSSRSCELRPPRLPPSTHTVRPLMVPHSAGALWRSEEQLSQCPSPGRSVIRGRVVLSWRWGALISQSLWPRGSA